MRSPAAMPLVTRLAEFVLLLTLSLTARASHSELACEILFSSPIAMNEASQEYLLRLNYLINERRLVSEEALREIAESPTPLNPVRAQANSVTLYPHHIAFLNLLKGDLQWELIRREAQILRHQTASTQKRERNAVAETSSLIRPILVKRYPFFVDRIVRTSHSRVIGISEQPAKAMIEAHDLRTDKLIYDSPDAGSLLWNGGKVWTSGKTDLWSLNSQSTGEIFTFNLSSKMSHLKPRVARLTLPSELASTVRMNELTFGGFVEKNGELIVVKYNSNFAYLFNATSGAFVKAVQLPDLENDLSDSKGSLGDSVFIGGHGSSYIIDPWADSPAQKWPDLNLIDGFNFQGQRYGLGIVKGSNSGHGTFRVKAVNRGTGEAFESFEVDAVSSYRLSQIFEQDGTLYGFLTSSIASYVVDLFNGKVIQSSIDLQKTMGIRMKLNWGEDTSGQIGFRFKEKNYLLGVLMDNDTFDEKELVILDAMTLRPTGPSYPLKDAVKSVQMLKNDKDQVSVILNFVNKTSELVSLIQPR